MQQYIFIGHRPFLCNDLVSQLSIIKPEHMVLKLIFHYRGVLKPVCGCRTGARLTEWADQRLPNRSPRSTFTMWTSPTIVCAKMYKYIMEVRIEDMEKNFKNVRGINEELKFKSHISDAPMISLCILICWQIQMGSSMTTGCERISY